MEEHIRQVIDSLPPGSQFRIALEEGWRGKGVHYPWMDLMRKEGVKRALVVVSFDWDGHARNMKTDRLVFYHKYDADCSQITDKRILNKISASGLGQQLVDFAFSSTSSSKWYSLDDKRQHTHGINRVYVYDDEWLPGPPIAFYDPSSDSSTLFPDGFFEDEAAVAQFVLSSRATHKNLDDALLRASVAVDDSCVINALVATGANVNPPQELGTTPLIISVQSGFANNVRALLKAGANPNAKDSDGETPRWIAEQGHGRSYPEVIKVLKEYGTKY